MTATRAAQSDGELLRSLLTAVQIDTATCAYLTSEVQSLKGLRAYSQASPEIVVAGFPLATTMSYNDIVLRILTRLDLAGLHSGILAIRKLNPKL